MKTEKNAIPMHVHGARRRGVFDLRIVPLPSQFALAVELGSGRRADLSPVRKNAFPMAPARDAFVEASELPG